MIPMFKSIVTALNNKVDKVSGKDLSSNDFTNDLKEKLEGISGGATAVSVEEIIVSPTEPTADRRKIWFQKGKNLFDGKIVNRYGLNEDGTMYGTLSRAITGFIAISANSNYCFSGATFKMVCIYDKDKNFVSSLNGSLVNTFSAPSNAKYVRLAFDNTVNYSNLQVEYGEEATEYEEYINPTIYVKKDNGEYNEFIKKEDEQIDITNEMEYATNEYIDGNRVYRKRMLLGYGPNNSSPKAYPIGVQGFNVIKTDLCLKQNALYIPLPLISADTAAIVNYYIDGTNLIIQAGRDRSSFLVRAEIYYIK